MVVVVVVEERRRERGGRGGGDLNVVAKGCCRSFDHTKPFTPFIQADAAVPFDHTRPFIYPRQRCRSVDNIKPYMYPRRHVVIKTKGFPGFNQS